MTDLPLYFLHGWGVDKNIWSSFVGEFFSKKITKPIDMPGYGVVNNVGQKRSLEEYCHELNKLIDEKGFVIAWSLGAQCAIKFACMFPEKVSALFLINCNPCFVKKQDWKYGIDRGLLFEMKNDLLVNKTKTLGRFFTLMTHGSNRQKETLAEIKSLSTENHLSAAALNNGLDLLINEDMRKDLELVNQPIMMCFSEGDQFVDKRLCLERPFVNDRISYSLTSNGDHVPFISSGKSVAEEIMKFIRVNNVVR